MRFLMTLLFPALLVPVVATGQDDRPTDGFLATLPSQPVSIDSLMGSNVISRIDNEPIGEVDDILIDREGKPLAVIVSVGAFFLGLGGKQVALDWSRVDLMPGNDNEFFDPDEPSDHGAGISTEEARAADATMSQSAPARTDWKPDDFVLVVNVSEATLEQAPRLDREDRETR